MKLEEKELIEQARMMGVPPHEFAAKFLTRDLVEASVTAVRKVIKLNENQEAKLIDQLNDDVKSMVSSAVAVIAANGRSAIVTTVKSVMVAGKSIRVVSDVDTSDPQRHALTDTVNHRALLVLAPDEYHDALDSNKPLKDQNDLPLETSSGSEEPFDETDDPLYQEAVQFVQETKRASISAVQRKLKIGYNRGARIIERMELEGIVTAMDSNGGREVVASKPAPELSPYELALNHVLIGGEISPKAIQSAAGIKRKDVADLILKLQENGVLSEPDPETGHRTLLANGSSETSATGDTKPAAQPGAEFDEDQYADAVLLVQREKKISLSFLKSNLQVDEETAEAMILRMEQDGVVSEPNDIGGRAVFD